MRDFGVGLAPGEEQLVFDRFWRADPARARTTGGTGLGLAIALEDARLHGGWLEAWGEPGRGSVFRLTLPRRAGEQLAGSPLPLGPGPGDVDAEVVGLDDGPPGRPRPVRRPGCRRGAGRARPTRAAPPRAGDERGPRAWLGGRGPRPAWPPPRPCWPPAGQRPHRGPPRAVIGATGQTQRAARPAGAAARLRSRSAIVQGFIAASASFAHHHAAARRSSTPAARLAAGLGRRPVTVIAESR